MRLTNKAQHGIKAMLYLTLRSPKGATRLADICKDQSISQGYLEQIFASLRDGKLVSGMRGPRGGYRLARPPEEISIAEIATCIDEKALQHEQTAKSEYDKLNRRVDESWAVFSDELYRRLHHISLADLINAEPLPTTPDDHSHHHHAQEVA